MRFEDPRGRLRIRGSRRPRARGPLGWAVLAVVLLGIGAAGSGVRYEPFAGSTPVAGDAPETPAQVQRETARLAGQLERLERRGRSIVIDRTHNRLMLREGDRVLLDVPVSTGSGVELIAPDRRWFFETPRGEFRVLRKIADPVWRKPDWAFVEEGRPVPESVGPRLDYEALGEYALYFGDGYMIHGTLYERLLGRSVTHGCIRVGREDLRRLYAAVEVGTPIHIF